MGSRRPSAAELQRVLGQGLPEPGEPARAVLLGEEPAVKRGRKDAANQARLGRDLEERLNCQHGLYESERRGLMVRQYPVPVFLRGGGITLRRSTVDYVGFNDGVHVAIEAKNPSSKPLDLQDREVMEPHQQTFLERWARAGGRGLYLMCFGDGFRHDAVVIDAAPVIRAVRMGVAAWRESDALAAGAVRCCGVDWAAALRAAEEAARR